MSAENKAKRLIREHEEMQSMIGEFLIIDPGTDARFIAVQGRARRLLRAIAGKPGYTPEELLPLAEFAKEKAVARRYAALRPILIALQREGVTTLGALCKALDEKGVKPARGSHWQKSSLRKILKALDSEPAHK